MQAIDLFGNTVQPMTYVTVSCIHPVIGQGFFDQSLTCDAKFRASDAGDVEGATYVCIITNVLQLLFNR
jgi:hypothetical protein